MKIHELGQISDKDLNKSFKGARINKREFLAASILEVQAGYHIGYTITCILQEMGLLSPKRNITKKGRAFLWFEYSKALPKWKR